MIYIERHQAHWPMVHPGAQPTVVQPQGPWPYQLTRDGKTVAYAKTEVIAERVRLCLVFDDVPESRSVLDELVARGDAQLISL